MSTYPDWGECAPAFDELRESVASSDLATSNEAQTRYTVIDRFIRSIFGWPDQMVTVEERDAGDGRGYLDYVLRCCDSTIVIEAKRFGSAFPNPTRRRRLLLKGSVLTVGEIGVAINQVRAYATSHGASVAVATNGAVWCCFDPSVEDGKASGLLFFPLDRPEDAEDLFRLLSQPAVEHGSLRQLSHEPEPLENRLLAVVHDADDRVGRNTVADHIAPALDRAIYASELLTSAEQMAINYVDTDARTRFDAQLGVHLSDARPESVTPATRIRRSKQTDELHDVVRLAEPSHAPPVTLLIGRVGSGKSTYLKHFELVSGSNMLAAKQAHWIYVDFEKMGPGDSPRKFLYGQLREYLAREHPSAPTDWRNAIEPAYDEEIKGLARGPLSLLYTANKPAFNQHVVDHVKHDYDEVEPYVDKVLRWLAHKSLCAVILDNIDLYEDDALEATALAEGLAFSRRVGCHVLVCIRESTYVAHKNDPSLDAYELRRLWLDPPPFKEVLARRLTAAKQALKGRPARIGLPNAMVLAVPDLSVFFDVVQRSVLAGPAGDLVDSLADGNIRRGMSMIASFLTSWHVQTDRAVRQYLEGETDYTFPFHEVFKGAVLGQWRWFKEGRTEGLNLFDAHLGARRVEPMRWWALQYLVGRASQEHTTEVGVSEITDFLSAMGASSGQVLACLRDLAEYSLLRELSAAEVTASSTVAITRSGAYYARSLGHTMVYVEQMMMDTAIFDPDTWVSLSSLTDAIDRERAAGDRMKLRAQRLAHFTQYLVDIEAEQLTFAPGLAHLTLMQAWRDNVMAETDRAIWSASRSHTQG